MTGFLRRNPKIKKKKAQIVASYHKDWCTYANFEMMYDMVYSRLVEGGLAEVLDEPVWMDEEGEVVDKESKALGMKVMHCLLHPDRMLMADKMGNNTNSCKDKPGKEFFYGSGKTQTQIEGTNDDQHFTVLGFNTFSRKPTLAVIIIKSKSPLSFANTYGVDLDGEFNSKQDEIEENTGPGKLYPGGPTYILNGKTVPAMVVGWDSGGITPKILHDALKRLDDLGVFPRGNGFPDPFLLVDGHGS